MLSYCSNRVLTYRVHSDTAQATVHRRGESGGIDYRGEGGAPAAATAHGGFVLIASMRDLGNCGERVMTLIN